VFTVLSLDILQFHCFSMVVPLAASHIKDVLQFCPNKLLFCNAYVKSDCLYAVSVIGVPRCLHLGLTEDFY